MRALSAELERSFAGLKKAEKTPLYYLAYNVTDTRAAELSSVAGAVNYEREDSYREIDIDARLNDLTLDNTHQVKAGGGQSRQPVFGQLLPVEDDPEAIRARV